MGSATLLPSYYPQFENPDLSSLPHPQTPDHQRAYTPGKATILTLGNCNRLTPAKPHTVNRLPLAPGAGATGKRQTLEFEEDRLVVDDSIE